MRVGSRIRPGSALSRSTVHAFMYPVSRVDHGQPGSALSRSTMYAFMHPASRADHGQPGSALSRSTMHVFMYPVSRVDHGRVAHRRVRVFYPRNLTVLAWMCKCYRFRCEALDAILLYVHVILPIVKDLQSTFFPFFFGNRELDPKTYNLRKLGHVLAILVQVFRSQLA